MTGNKHFCLSRHIKAHYFIQWISISMSQNNKFSNILHTIKWGGLDLFSLYFRISCLIGTTKLLDKWNIWHWHLTLLIRKILNFWSQSFLVFLACKHEKSLFQKWGDFWSYTGFDAHLKFFFLNSCNSTTHEIVRASKIRENYFPAV